MAFEKYCDIMKIVDDVLCIETNENTSNLLRIFSILIIYLQIQAVLYSAHFTAEVSFMR